MDLNNMDTLDQQIAKIEKENEEILKKFVNAKKEIYRLRIERRVLYEKLLQINPIELNELIQPTPSELAARNQ